MKVFKTADIELIREARTYANGNWGIPIRVLPFWNQADRWRTVEDDDGHRITASGSVPAETAVTGRSPGTGWPGS